MYTLSTSLPFTKSRAFVCCCVSLSEVIVEYGTGHLVVHNVLNNLYQSINAYQVDVFVYSSASCLDCLQSTKCHCIVVAEYNVDLVAVLGQSVCCDLLTLWSDPSHHAALVSSSTSTPAACRQSLDGFLGSVLSIYVLRIALNHDVTNNAVAVCIALVLKLSDLFALVCTGLSSISTYISSFDAVRLPKPASLSASGSRLM